MGRETTPFLVRAGAIALLATTPSIASAHWGRPLAPEELAGAWNFDPVVLINLAAIATLYAVGLAKSRASSARSTWRMAAFVGGMFAVVVALLSPVDALSDQLAWAHMLQHMILMLVAAPLFALSVADRAVARSLPSRWRKRLGRWLAPASPLRNVAVVWGLYAIANWVWHIPIAYESALAHRGIHDLEHLSFFVTAYLFWSLLLHPSPRVRVSGVAAVLVLFATSLHSSALGIFMTLAPRPWYPTYETRAPLWGLTPLEDQQLAGSIMWMPSCLVYVAAAAALVGLSLERDSTERELIATETHPTKGLDPT